MPTIRTRRTALLCALVPLATAGLLAVGGPANAIPFEGEPTSSTCLRVVPLAGTGPAGSTLFVSHGWVAVLVERAACSTAR